MGLERGGKWAESKYARGGQGGAAGWEEGLQSNRPLSFCGIPAPTLWSGVYSVSPISPLCYPLGQ